MDDSQVINNYDNIPDVIFYPNSNEMDKNKCKIIWITRVRSWFYH